MLEIRDRGVVRDGPLQSRSAVVCYGRRASCTQLDPKTRVETYRGCFRNRKSQL